MIATVGDLLLADILVHPEDNGLRLIYADWLADNGQEERGEFIRVQVEKAELDAAKPTELSERRTLLRERARGLLSDHAHNWFADAFHCLGGSLEPAWFAQWWSWLNRGFLAEIHCPLATWVAHGKAICATHPVERVEVTDRRPHRESMPASVAWTWTQEALTAPHGWEWELPLSVCRHLPVSKVGIWTWGSEDAAIAALSEALLIMAGSPSALARQRGRDAA